MVQGKATVSMVKYKDRSLDSFLMFWCDDFFFLTNGESECIKYISVIGAVP